MKVTLHLEGTRQEILNQVSEFTTTIGASLDAQPPAAERKRAKKETKPAEDEGDFDLDGDDEDTAEEETEEDEIDLDRHLVPAFQTFVKKKPANKEKAVKLLQKYGVKSVRDIPAKKFKEVMAAIQ